MQCCPLSAPDDDGPRVSLIRVRRARAAHVCGECKEVILTGTQYEICTQNDDGMWSTFKTCMSCVEIRNHFSCGGWYWGKLWEDIESNFFPDMKAGGPCMEGLSPSAKARLFDRRIAWIATEDGRDQMREHEVRKRLKAEREVRNWWYAWQGIWGQIGRTFLADCARAGGAV